MNLIGSKNRILVDKYNVLFSITGKTRNNCLLINVYVCMNFDIYPSFTKLILFFYQSSAQSIMSFNPNRFSCCVEEPYVVLVFFFYLWSGCVFDTFSISIHNVIVYCTYYGTCIQFSICPCQHVQQKLKNTLTNFHEILGNGLFKL